MSAKVLREDLKKMKRPRRSSPVLTGERVGKNEWRVLGTLTGEAGVQKGVEAGCVEGGEKRLDEAER